MIKDRYIVVMKADTSASESATVRSEAKTDGAKIRHTYAAALNGFAATLDADALAGVRANPNVAYVEADQVMRADATQSPATWGIDRVDQRALPLSNSYTYNYTGADVKVYIIDTGIRTSHSLFQGRAIDGTDAVDGALPAADCNGHGTHVAGTVGSSTYGVAKGATLVAVRVLDCNGSGSTSGVVTGINWVTSNHAAGAPAAANMSLGGGASTALDNAVANSIADGVTYALAAGNDNGSNACNGSPGRTPAGITVGSTTSSDARSSFSNIGTCLDIFAPGSSIMSTWNTSDSATNTISGTSMATPHVAGAAALFLEENPSATAQQVRDGLVNSATNGVVGNAGAGSPNKLLYTLGGSAPPGPGTCATLANTYNASLTSQASSYQPGTGGFTSPGGSFRGCLDGPNGTDFDLYLQKRNSSGTWVSVAQGITSAPDEEFTYSGTSGTYRWRVHAYSGSGAFTLKSQHP